MTVLRVAGIQHDIVWEDKAANLARLQPLVAKAAADGAGLILLTEMFSTGFSMATDRVAEPPDGPSVEFLRDQAAEHGAWVGGSIPVRRITGDTGNAGNTDDADDADERPVNQFVLAGPNAELHRYAKIHPFTYGGETDHYAAGDTTITVDIGGVRTTPFVCYDLRFADVFWNAARTTDLYLVVANWPAARRHHWRALLTARAIENQAWVVGVNRVGHGGGLDYAGGTCVIDPMGDTTAEAAGAHEEIVVADVDVDAVIRARTRFPFFADR